jgi:hypothetical protein
MKGFGFKQLKRKEGPSFYLTGFKDKRRRNPPAKTSLINLSPIPKSNKKEKRNEQNHEMSEDSEILDKGQTTPDDTGPDIHTTC